MTPNTKHLEILSEEREVWKWITGYKGLYKVSSLGNIMTFNGNRGTGKKMKAVGKLMSLRKSGNYLRVALCNAGVQEIMDVHRIVAINFIKNPNNLREVNHKNKNKLDNRVKNLDWVSSRENKAHYQNMIGASYKRSENNWIGNININRKQIYLGRFKTQEEAHISYLFATILYGISNKYL